MLVGHLDSVSKVGLAELNFQYTAPPKPACCARHGCNKNSSQAIQNHPLDVSGELGWF
jgi:hypothetical protein